MVAGYAFGDGRITLLADAFWFHNSQLLYPDHARLLLALADQGDGPVLFCSQRSIAGGAFRLVMATVTGFLLDRRSDSLDCLWVWSRLPRLGPVMASDDNHVTQNAGSRAGYRALRLASQPRRVNWIAPPSQETADRASQPALSGLALTGPSRARPPRLQRLCPDVFR